MSKLPRYEIHEHYGRGETSQWFILDHHQQDEVTGAAKVVRQENKLDDALATLQVSDGFFPWTTRSIDPRCPVCGNFIPMLTTQRCMHCCDDPNCGICKNELGSSPSCNIGS